MEIPLSREVQIVKDYLALQYAALAREKPDLVVLMGDNAEGGSLDEIQKRFCE